MNMVTLPPGTIMHQFGRDLDAEPAMQVLRYRLAQGRDAGRVGIAVLAVAQSLDRRLDDMGRRFEIRLADAEIDDVAALPLQFGGLREHGEGVLLAHARESGIECDQGGVPREKATLLAKPRGGGKGRLAGLVGPGR